MRSRNLEVLIDLPIDAVRHRFRTSPSSRCCRSTGPSPDATRLLVAMPTDVAVITADPHRRQGWMMSLAPLGGDRTRDRQHARDAGPDDGLIVWS